MDFFFLFCVLSLPPAVFVLWSPAGKGLTSCVFVIFPYGVLGQVWYLIVKIPDLCLLPYFARIMVIGDSSDLK